MWTTAKPFLERWMNEQLGWRAILDGLKQEAPNWPHSLPQLPRLVHQALTQEKPADLSPLIARLEAGARRQNFLLTLIAVLLLILLFNHV